MQAVDITIVGGGLVGASLARALASLPLRIALIEKALPHVASTDTRSLSLSLSSYRILENLGFAEALQSHLTPIKKIHVSNRGHFGFTRLQASEMHVPAFGYMIAAAPLQDILKNSLRTQANLVLKDAMTVCDLKPIPEGYVLTLNSGEQLQTRLLIAADGGNSSIRQQLNIQTTAWDYGQVALVANVGLTQSHDFTAYERFTDTGPLALLPTGERSMAMVWTTNTEDVPRWLALDDVQFLQALQTRFGYRLGRLATISPRKSFPLGLRRAAEIIRPGLVLIGNAAHQLHPVAGQGLNLGLRDVATLAQVIANAQQQGEPLGSLHTLENYARWRHADHLKIVGFTDGVNRVFSNTWAPLSVLRNLGLVALDAVPAFKKSLAHLTMGLDGRLPNLVRGLPLQD